MAVCDSLLIMNMIIGLTAHRLYLSLIFSTSSSATVPALPESLDSSIYLNTSLNQNEFAISPAIRSLKSSFDNTSFSHLPLQTLKTSSYIDGSSNHNSQLSLSYFLVLFNPSVAILKRRDHVNGTYAPTMGDGIDEYDNASYRTSLDYHMIETFFEILLYLVLGRLRESEEHDLMLTARDYLFQKCLFMLLVLDANTFEERFAWERWFRTLGTTLLSAKLCKDRFEHLATNSPTLKKWQMVKICLLMTLVSFVTIACNLSLPSLTDFSVRTVLLRADASYVLVFVFSVIVRMAISLNSMRADSSLELAVPLRYYTDLIFGVTLLVIELLHNLLLFKVSGSIIFKGVCSLKFYTILVDLRELYLKHKLHAIISRLVSLVASATSEEIESFNDKCAICWDAMKTARKLPCGHLFHETCLKSWLVQDRSCATCRSNICRQMKVTVTGEAASLVQRLELQVLSRNNNQFAQVDHELNLGQQVMNVNNNNPQNNGELRNRLNPQQQVNVTPPRQMNRFFRFDSSRYINHPLLSWLPSISIEAFI